MNPLLSRASIALAAAEIRKHYTETPRVAVILGTGLGGLASEIEAAAEIPYKQIPGFPHSTAPAHKGRLLLGNLLGLPCAMLAGRCHFYEGYQLEQLMFPTLVMRELGCQYLIVSNAAGGVNPLYETGDVMLMDDHINLMHFKGSVAVPAASPERVERFQEHLYDRTLLSMAESAAIQEGFIPKRGVYVAVSGPTYETRAEYRLFRRIGGDVVGMSTVPEVLAATSVGMRVMGISTVTNVAKPDAMQTVSSDEVIDVAERVQHKVRSIVRGVIERIAAAD